MFKFIAFLCCFVSPMVIASKSTPPQLKVGEKPFWSNGSVYYVDMYGKKLYRYSLAEDHVYETAIVNNDHNIDLFVPVKGSPNKFIVGLDNTAALIQWDGVSSTASRERDLFSVEPNTILNGLVVSPQNDWYTGNYDKVKFCASPPPKYGVFGYMRDKKLKTFADAFQSSVGLVLIEKIKTVYQVDTCKQTISSFKWNPTNGNLSDQQTVMKLDLPNDVLPAGLAADTNGNLYTGAYNGGQILKIDPIKRKIIDRIPVPVRYVTAPVFGGPNLDILFVTSAGLEVDFRTGHVGNQIAPPAGHLFQIQMNVQGIPAYLPRLD